MAFSKPLALFLVALAAAAMSAAGQQQGCSRKVTVQNLCSRDLNLGIEPLANSPHLFPNGYALRQGTHTEYPVCTWTGRISTQGAPVVEFHLGQDGGAWYQVSTAQADGGVRVSVTPHGRPLQGHCPTAGCSRGHCFEHSVPGGNCHAVDEIKIVYCST